METNHRGKKNEMFLGTDREGRNSWLIASYWGNLHVIQIIYVLAKNRITTEEININRCYAHSKRL